MLVMQGDKIINDVLDVTLAREDTYTHSAQTTTEAEKVFQDTMQLNTVDGEIPTFTGEKSKHLTNKFNVEIRTKVRNATRAGVQEKLSNHAKNLHVQGNLLTLANQEKEDLIWKSSMFQLKSGTLKFMLNACIDTLPTPANLMRWKYTSTLWNSWHNKSLPELLQSDAGHKPLHMATQQPRQFHCDQCGTEFQSVQ